MKYLFTLIALVLAQGAWAQQWQKISGRVLDSDNQPVAGVVVNNGIYFTQSDEQGRWTLSTDTALCKFVSISTPAEYELNDKEGLASGYYIKTSDALKQTPVFRLVKRKAPVSHFTYVAISDPQVRDEKEMNRWRTETVVDMCKLAAQKGKLGPVVGMTLGDLVFDAMPLYEPYAQSCKNLGMTVYQTIGNHDFDKRYQDLHNMHYGTPVYGEQRFNNFFGPTDYSFNIGNVHVVSMKNINYVGHKIYIEDLTDAQLEWLKKDLSYVPKDKIVFLNMHAAAWNTVEAQGNVRNAKALKSILSSHRTHVFCGHTHYFQNIVVSDSLYQHNIGAACGAWWAGQVNQCGAPNGYLVVDVDADNIKWHYKATGKPFDYQLRVYRPGDFSLMPNAVVANVWDVDKDCLVTWAQDGKDMGKMEQFVSSDQAYLDQLNKKKKKSKKAPVRTGHLFKAVPKAGWKTVTVTFTNRFGETYSQTVQHK